MSARPVEIDADRGLLAGIIEGAYPGQVNGWYLADLIFEAGFTRAITPGDHHSACTGRHLLNGAACIIPPTPTIQGDPSCR